MVFLAGRFVMFSMFVTPAFKAIVLIIEYSFFLRMFSLAFRPNLVINAIAYYILWRGSQKRTSIIDWRDCETANRGGTRLIVFTAPQDSILAGATAGRRTVAIVLCGFTRLTPSELPGIVNKI